MVVHWVEQYIELSVELDEQSHVVVVDLYSYDS